MPPRQAGGQPLDPIYALRGTARRRGPSVMSFPIAVPFLARTRLPITGVLRG